MNTWNTGKGCKKWFWGVGGQEDCGERETGAGGEIRRIEDADWNLDAETRRLRLDLDLGEGKGEWEGGEWRKRGERGVEGGAESQQDGRA